MEQSRRYAPVHPRCLRLLIRYACGAAAESRSGVCFPTRRFAGSRQCLDKAGSGTPFSLAAMDFFLTLTQLGLKHSTFSGDMLAPKNNIARILIPPPRPWAPISNPRGGIS